MTAAVAAASASSSASRLEFWRWLERGALILVQKIPLFLSLRRVMHSFFHVIGFEAVEAFSTEPTRLVAFVGWGPWSLLWSNPPTIVNSCCLCLFIITDLILSNLTHSHLNPWGASRKDIRFLGRWVGFQKSDITMLKL